VYVRVRVCVFFWHGLLLAAALSTRSGVQKYASSRWALFHHIGEAGGLLRGQQVEALLGGHALLRKLVVRRKARCRKRSKIEVREGIKVR